MSPSVFTKNVLPPKRKVEKHWYNPQSRNLFAYFRRFWNKLLNAGASRVAVKGCKWMNGDKMCFPFIIQNSISLIAIIYFTPYLDLNFSFSKQLLVCADPKFAPTKKSSKKATNFDNTICYTRNTNGQGCWNFEIDKKLTMVNMTFVLSIINYQSHLTVAMWQYVNEISATGIVWKHFIT